MTFNLNKTNRIVLNPCGGFDWQQADVDSKTGLIRTHTKTGNEVWTFHEFHPTLERLLESYVMQTAAVLDETLEDAYRIMAVIRTEYAAVKKLFGPVSEALNAAVAERDKLREQMKARKKDA